jgi:hypothetical protein
MFTFAIRVMGEINKEFGSGEQCFSDASREALLVGGNGVQRNFAHAQIKQLQHHGNNLAALKG